MIDRWELGHKIPMGRNSPNTETVFSDVDSDSKENWEKIKNKYPEWKEDSFTYKFNSYGYRSREFKLDDERPLILACGCSHTNGIGIPFHETWVEHFGKKFPKHRVYNFGQGAASNDTIARTLVNVIPILKPELVLVLWTYNERFETYENGSTSHHGPWSEEKFIFPLDRHNALNSYRKNKLIVNLIQEKYNFQLIENHINSLDRLDIEDSGRDGIHHGIYWHREVAEIYYKKYV